MHNRSRAIWIGTVLALGLVLIPIVVSVVGMYSRLLNAQIGEGVIVDDLIGQ